MFDLLTADGTRHANAKVSAFAFSVLAAVVVACKLLLVKSAFTWPDVAAVGMLPSLPTGLDAVKTIAKLRWGPKYNA